MSASVYDYMSSTYINTHSHINHNVCWKLLTANPGVIYTRLCGLRRPPHFDLSLIHSVTYRQLNMQSYVQVSSFSPSAPQTDVKKLLCARKCRFGKSTQWFRGVLLETHISENRCYQGKGAPDSRLCWPIREQLHIGPVGFITQVLSVWRVFVCIFLLFSSKSRGMLATGNIQVFLSEHADMHLVLIYELYYGLVWFHWPNGTQTLSISKPKNYMQPRMQRMLIS